MNIIKKGFKLIKREPISVSLFVTNRCNSMCNICHIWKKQPKEDLSIDLIKKVLNDPLIKKDTLFGVHGGELFCHPQYEEILELFKNRSNFTLYTNGLMKDKVIEAVRKYKPSELGLSLDGGCETYKKVRGVDAFDKNMEIIETLHKEVPIQINYVINPLNTRDDLKEVKAIVDKYKLNLTLTIYETPEFFETSLPKNSQIYETEDIAGKNKFLKCYNSWKNGKLYLPCNSTRINFVVWPNGLMNLCQAKNVTLGDLNKNTVSEIWNSKFTKELQKKYRKCNGCWFFCQRNVDVQIYGRFFK